MDLHHDTEAAFPQQAVLLIFVSLVTDTSPSFASPRRRIPEGMRATRGLALELQFTGRR